jgi:hypothetical protein
MPVDVITQEILDAAFERAAEYRRLRNLASEVDRNAMANDDFDKAREAGSRSRDHWHCLQGALAVLAVMLDGLGYDMKPTYPDGPTPCSLKAEAELEKWLERRWAEQRKN